MPLPRGGGWLMFFLQAVVFAAGGQPQHQRQSRSLQQWDGWQPQLSAQHQGLVPTTDGANRRAPAGGPPRRPPPGAPGGARARPVTRPAAAEARMFTQAWVSPGDRGGSRPVADRPGRSPWPRMFLLGVRRAGLASLHGWVSSFRGACQAVRLENEGSHQSREIHFFDNDERFNRGVGFYLRHFHSSDRACHYIDGTTSYLADEHAPVRLHGTAPPPIRTSMRFIVALREPVSRDLSWFNHWYIRHYISEENKGRLPLWVLSLLDSFPYLRNDIRPTDESSESRSANAAAYAGHIRRRVIAEARGRAGEGHRSPQEELFPQADVAATQASLFQGYYAEQLQRWAAVWPRSQLFVLNYASLVGDGSQAQEMLHSIAEFLKVGPYRWRTKGLNHTMSAPFRMLSSAQRVRRASQLSSTGGKEKFTFPAIPPTASPHIDIAEVPVDSCAALTGHYAPHNAQLYAWLAKGGGPIHEPPFPPFVSPECELHEWQKGVKEGYGGTGALALPH